MGYWLLVMGYWLLRLQPEELSIGKKRIWREIVRDVSPIHRGGFAEGLWLFRLSTAKGFDMSGEGVELASKVG